MSRLARDLPATIAALRITQKNLTLFVESDENDAFVYEKLCKGLGTAHQCDFEIRESREVIAAGKSGGKTVLLALFEETVNHNLLTSVSANGRKKVGFILDKDIDDILQIAKLHKHIIYTPAYHCENLLAVAGDLKHSVSSAFSLTGSDLDTLCRDAAAKLKQMAACWREWVILCVLSSRLQVKFASNYSVLSKVNTPLSGPSNGGLVTAIRNDIYQRSGLQQTVFDQEEQLVTALINALYSSDDHDLVFKGLWYVDILADAAIQLGFTNLHKISNQKASVWAVLRATIDVNHAVFAQLSSRISALMI